MSVIDRELFEKLFRVDPSVPRVGLLREGDLAILLALLKAFRPRRVAEFGVEAGETARWALAECPFIERYFGIDVPPQTVPELAYQAGEVPWHAGLWAGSDPRFELLISPRGTRDLGPADLAPLDFVFIDGDHSPDGGRHDTWLARESGARVIVWHDYNNPPAVGPAIVIDELNRAEGDRICLIAGTTICFEIRGDRAGGQPDAIRAAAGGSLGGESSNPFSPIYAGGGWEGRGSGRGSQPDYAQAYCRFLENFLRYNRIKSVVDFGCGDWAFSRQVDWSAIDYTGIDCVASIIGQNKSRFEGPGIRFVLNHVDDLSFPPCDLLIVKDVLQHWSHERILRFLPTTPATPLVLLVNDFKEGDNADIPDGAHRRLDLQRPPFNERGAIVFAFDDRFDNKVVLLQQNGG